MTHEWYEQIRRPGPREWLGLGACTESAVVLACPRSLVIVDVDTLAIHTQTTDHDAVSLAVIGDGRIVCVGEERTTVLTSALTYDRVVSGEECPDPNHNGHYAASSSYFVHLSTADEVKLVARSTDDWSVVATCSLSPRWHLSPTSIWGISDDCFYLECPQENMAAVAKVTASFIDLFPIRCRGPFLGLLDQRRAYATDNYDGKVTIATLPDAKRVKSFPVAKMTPVTVPQVFTAVAERRGASVETAECMFDDTFVDKAGRAVPFPVWTGSLDGTSIFAMHEDGYMRIWRPAG